MEAFTRGEDPALYIVTAAVDGTRDGCLVGFVTQCSIIPERFLACLSVLNATFALAQHADGLAVHRLASGQRELADRFGSTTGPEADKFAGLSWTTGKSGAPVIDGCAAYLEGTIQARIPLGDHWGFVLAPIDSGEGSGGEPLRTHEAHVVAAHPPRELFER